MKLTTEQIKSILTGAIRFEESELGLCPRRFNERQPLPYCERYALHTRASAGVRLSFITDSSSFEMTYFARTVSSQYFCYFDVFLDGKEVMHFGHDNVTEVASTLHLDLPEGEHTVTVYFPNLFETVIRSVSLDDGASLAPAKRPLRYFAFGDSITQGYICERASLSYANQIADKLNAEITNFGIGGDVFSPHLIDFDADVADPDIITVAYGTNDWNKTTRERTLEKSHEFYARLRERFPHAKIFAITPIWRADTDRVTDVGALPDSITDIVTAAASAQQGITVIRGWELVPHIPDLFYDLYLHPNDMGFRCYADALFEKMTPYLNEIKK